MGFADLRADCVLYGGALLFCSVPLMEALTTAGFA